MFWATQSTSQQRSIHSHVAGLPGKLCLGTKHTKVNVSQQTLAPDEQPSYRISMQPCFPAERFSFMNNSSCCKCIMDQTFSSHSQLCSLVIYWLLVLISTYLKIQLNQKHLLVFPPEKLVMMWWRGGSATLRRPGTFQTSKMLQQTEINQAKNLCNQSKDAIITYKIYKQWFGCSSVS